MDLDTLVLLETFAVHPHLAVITFSPISYIIKYITVCPAGQVSIGKCVNDQCPDGYTCVGTFPNNYCCGAEDTVTCDSVDAVGPCVGGICPDGYVCDTSQSQCCPDVIGEPAGPCLPPDNACPTGSLIIF